MGGNSEGYLRMSGNTDNLLNCKVIDLTSSSISFLKTFSLDFSQPAAVTASLASTDQNAVCFQGEPLAGKLLADLQSILGITVPATTTLRVTQVDVYHLSQ